MPTLSFPVYLLRHGETEWNAEGRLQGHLDSALTETGRMQAEAQGALLRPILAAHPNITAHTSPLGRAATTAKIALSGSRLGAKPLTSLKEISAGSWDGKTFEQIEETNGPLFNAARNAFELMFLSPDGETEEAVLVRARDVLAQLTGPSILITHGALLCILRGLLRGLPFDEMLDLTHAQGCVYRLEAGREDILRSP